MLPLLSAAEIAQMQADLVASTLPDTCVIQTLTHASDGAGGINDTWAAAGTVPCRMDFKTGLRKEIGASWETYSGWMLTVPVTTTIGTANHVVHQAYTYSITFVEDVGRWAACKRVKVERLWR